MKPRARHAPAGGPPLPARSRAPVAPRPGARLWGKVSPRSAVAALALAGMLMGPVPAPAAPPQDPGGSAAPAAGPGGLNPDPPFRVGEVLTYSISYAFVEAGTLRLAVNGIESIDGRQAYLLDSRAQTNSTISALYSLTDHLQSWMDVEHLYSLRYVREAVEKGKKREKRLRFDQDRHIKTFEDNGKEKAIAPDAQDDVSILYYLRTLPFAEGRTFVLNNLADPEDNPMKLTVLGTEKVKVPAGTFDCYVVRMDLHTDSGVFSQGAEIKAWMTRDRRHVMTRLQSKLPVGSFKVELTSFKAGEDAPQAPEPSPEASSERSDAAAAGSVPQVPAR